jgi:WD40 repeat protein
LFVWDLAAVTEPTAYPVSDREAGAAVAIGGANDPIVTVSSDGQLHLVRPGFDAPVGRALYALPALDYDRPKQPLDVASDGSTAVSLDPSGRVIVWDLEGRAALGPLLPDGGPADDLAVLADGSVLTRSIPGSRLLDRDGRIRFDHPTTSEGADTVNAIGADGDRWAFAANDQLFGSNSATAAPEPIATLPNSPVLALAPLPNERWAALAPKSLAIVGRGVQPEVVTISGNATSLAVTGHWIFVGDSSGVVHTIDVEQPTAPERTIRAHEFDIASMTVAADGHTLATGSDDRTVVLWTVGADGALDKRLTLRGNEERVVSASFSPDGRWLATASEDSLVRLFSLDLGAQLGDPMPANVDGGFVLPRIRFDPTADRRLYVAATGLSAWDLRPDGWRQMACGIIGTRRLVAVEQDLYLRGVAPIDPCP